MAIIKSVRGFTPKFGKDCFLADSAVVMGDVKMGDNCSIWFNAVVRGDVHSIRLGNKVNVQDGAVIHATYQKAQPILAIMFQLLTMRLFMGAPFTIMF